MTTYDFYYKEYERKLTKRIYTQPHYDDLLVITNFLPENSHYAERIYCLLNDIKERPVCEHCGGFVKFPHHLRKEERGYRRFCSTTCSNNNENVQKEKSKTCMANYGVDNPSKSEVVHDRKVKTVMKNYGGFMMASPIIKENIIKTNIEKYGVEYATMLAEIKQKSKETLIKNYGEIGMGHSDIQEKTKNTKIEKYGDNVFKDVAKKSMATKIKIYGESAFVDINKKSQATLYKKYGKNYRKIIAKKSCETKLKKYGKVIVGGNCYGYSNIANKYIENFIKKNNLKSNLCLYGKNEMLFADNDTLYFFDLVVFKTKEGFDNRDINEISHILEYDGDTWHPTIDQAVTYRDQPMPICKNKYRDKYLKDLKKRMFAMKLMIMNNGSFHHVRQTNKKRKLP